MTNDDLNPEKVRQLIADAWARLDPQDRAERIAYDQAQGIPGTTMQTNQDDDLIEFVRGGRRLALVHRDVLCGDGPLNTESHFVPDSPDADIEKLMDDQQGDDK